MGRTGLGRHALAGADHPRRRGKPCGPTRLPLRCMTLRSTRCASTGSIPHHTTPVLNRASTKVAPQRRSERGPKSISGFKLVQVALQIRRSSLLLLGGPLSPSATCTAALSAHRAAAGISRRAAAWISRHWSRPGDLPVLTSRPLREKRRRPYVGECRPDCGPPTRLSITPRSCTPRFAAHATTHSRHRPFLDQ